MINVVDKIIKKSKHKFEFVDLGWRNGNKI